MDEFLICLDPATARFYGRIARSAGLTTEQVLRDALFKLAGELSLEALLQKKSRGRNETIDFPAGFDIV